MSDEKVVVVTEDAAMREGGKLHAVDREVLNATRGIAIDSVEKLHALAEAAKRTFDLFDAWASAHMTPARARRIRQLRVDQGYSWRAVAAECFEEWGDDAKWSPPSNQIAGMALCRHAALVNGEHEREPPWN